MSVPSYKDRLLETHGVNMWSTFRMDRAIRSIKSCNLTGIIFHRNELTSRVAFPDKYFDKDELLSSNPVRNSVAKNYRYYLRPVLDKCRKNGLEFYGGVKEIYFHNGLITEYPQLRGEDDALCATDSFWWEFLEEKCREFFAMFPDVAGIIVSPGTRESMVSSTVNRCTCRRYRNYDVNEWYRNLLAAIHQVIDEAGEKLIIRDFSYTKVHQYAVVDAAGSVSDNTTIPMKKVPHDYYPVFPDNPAIGNCKKLDQWVEFDTRRQFFDLEVFPYNVSEDMRGRMQWYLDKGVTGIMLRTGWENMTQSSVFCGFSTLNLIVGAMTSFDMNTDMDAVCNAWFDHGLVSPLTPDSYSQIPCKITEGKGRELFREVIQLRWKVLEKGIHIRGHMLNRNCQILDRYDLTYSIIAVFHGQSRWEPNASRWVEPTGKNTPVMIAEKGEALAMARKLKDTIATVSPDINRNIKIYLEFMAEGFLIYIEGFRLELTSTVYTKKTEISQDPGDVQKTRETLTGYEELTSRYDSLMRSRRYFHVMEYMLDGDWLIRFKTGVSRVLDVV